MKQGALFPEPDGRDAIHEFDLPDAEVRLDRTFLTVVEADRMFEQLREDTDWEQERTVMYGREVRAPRLTAWYGDASYKYSGVTHDPRPWTRLLQELRERVEAAADRSFNSVLLNFYRDGNDSVAWHCDDEPELGRAPVIASLSLGAERVFQLKHKSRSDLPRVDIMLPHGSLLIMAGVCQSHWKHQLPKRKGLRAGRINLTFRATGTTARSRPGRTPDPRES